MLKILGSANRFHHTLNRREVLRAGGLGALGLSLPGLMRLRSSQAADKPRAATFGRAKRIMLLYLQGAASQFETWDPKPDAPEEIRGPWRATSTAVPGTHICDQLPKLARVTDRMAIVRSMTHEYNNHSNVYTLSGHPAADFSSETNPADTRHHPFFGSVLDYLADQRGVPRPDVPRNIALPFRFSKYSPKFRRAGPYGSFLGAGYDPVWTELDGKATKKVPRISFFNSHKDVDVEDPYLGITPESRLRIMKAGGEAADFTLDRLSSRLSLREQLEREKRRFAQTRAGRDLDRFRAMAHSLLTSKKLDAALDVGREPMRLREQYGMTLFGQAALTGRRLLEAGCPLVSVFWDEVKVVNTAWDTHYKHTSRLGEELLPGFDAAVSTLLVDMQRRGLLEETLVMCLTEHGRTPRVSEEKRGGGRNHWSKSYSVMLAGAGIRAGTVVGATDRQGGAVIKRTTTPEDILATMYHLVGVDPDTTIRDRLDRPVRLVANGAVVPELIA